MKSKEAFNVFVLHRVLDGNTLSFTDIDLTTLRHILSKSEFTFRTVDNALKGGTSSKTSACLTFDDGFSSDYNIVLPELKKKGASATFFVVTDWLNKPGYLTGEQLKCMSNEGMQIGSHSKSHPNFLTISPEERLFELKESKAILEEIIGVKVSSFAFPFGLLDDECCQAVFAAGYSICCTSLHGLSKRSESIISRNSINARTSANRIDKILEAGILQRLSWFLEDRIKPFLKRYMPNVYISARNFISRL